MESANAKNLMKIVKKLRHCNIYFWCYLTKGNPYLVRVKKAEVLEILSMQNDVSPNDDISYNLHTELSGMVIGKKSFLGEI